MNSLSMNIRFSVTQSPHLEIIQKFQIQVLQQPQLPVICCHIKIETFNITLLQWLCENYIHFNIDFIRHK